MNLTNEEKNTLKEIILYSIDDFNCYNKISLINNKKSKEYISTINELANNHKIEKSLYNLLDCRTDSKYNQICSYIFNKCDELKVDNKLIMARILSKLDDDYTLNAELNRLLDNPNDEDNIATFVAFISEHYIDLDFKRIFINELGKHSNKNIITTMYNNIFTDFSLEEEMIKNRFNFKTLEYMYSKIYFQIFVGAKQLLDEDMIDMYYEQSLRTYCVNNINQIIQNINNLIVDDESAIKAYVNLISYLILVQSDPNTVIKGLKNVSNINTFLKDLEQNKKQYKKLSLTR